MDSKRKVFDAHHHMWNLDHCRYPWLMAKGVKRFFGDPTPIQKNYLVADLFADACEFELIGSTHIQVGVAEEDAVKETVWLQSLAELNRGIPSAIIGFADLTRDDLDNHLDAHAREEIFRGVRQIIGRHPDEDSKTNTGALLEEPAFLHGLKLLEKRNLTFDLQLVASQYVSAAELLAKTPNLAVAICHFASPWDLTREGFTNWHHTMKAFSGLPNCTIKFSGFGMFKADWTAEDIKPYVETALELFGEDRCMAGSNFPVDKIYGGYDRIWVALEKLLPDETILTKVTRTNAQRFYSVDAHC